MKASNFFLQPASSTKTWLNQPVKEEPTCLEGIVRKVATLALPFLWLYQGIACHVTSLVYRGVNLCAKDPKWANFVETTNKLGTTSFKQIFPSIQEIPANFKGKQVVKQPPPTSSDESDPLKKPGKNFHETPDKIEPEFVPSLSVPDTTDAASSMGSLTGSET